jgi:penicillin-binding protein 1A
MVTAYATIANGGYKVEPWFIEKIVSEADGLLYQATPAVVCEELPGSQGMNHPR